MPGWPCRKKKSPTIAPITDRPAEMRKPAKIAGMPAGSCRRQRRVNRLESCNVKRSCWPWSADNKPKSVLLMIGKIAMSTHTITRLRKLKSNQNPISGTSARIGIVWSTTA